MFLKKVSLYILMFCGAFGGVNAQSPDSDTNKVADKKLIEELTYQQQPGLALAASKIFFSEKRYSISGFGEVNYVSHQNGPNVGLGDLEMYFSNLYRVDTHAGFDRRLLPNDVNNPFVRGDLSIWTLGFNFNTSDNLVFKANYQIRSNKNTSARPEGNLFEVGVGFIF